MTELAALRGNPSFIWRDGQQRHLDMILRWGVTNPATTQRILIDGCGVGMYANALQAYSEQIYGIDIEAEYLPDALKNAPDALLSRSACERLPFAKDSFDLVLSHEVLEHVSDDRASTEEIVRVLKPGGRGVIIVPNRWFPFETHGHYWRGVYHFGNTPLINYLPNPLRNQLAPHVRVYTSQELQELFNSQPVKIVYHTQIFPGYDNLTNRHPLLGQWVRSMTYALEQTPLKIFGLYHVFIIEKYTT